MLKILIEKRPRVSLLLQFERLDNLRASQIANKETPRYDGHCQSLTKEECKKKIDAGKICDPPKNSDIRRMLLQR